MIGKPPVFAGCDECSRYAARRGPKVMPLILRTAARVQVTPALLARLFFEGVHERHLSGRSL